MPWNLFLLPLIGGYYIISRSYRVKFRQQLLDRQRLLFDSVLYGFVLLLVSYCATTLFCYYFEETADLLKLNVPMQVPFLGTSMLSLVLAFTFTAVYNYFADEVKHQKAAIRKLGNEFERLLLTSNEEQTLIEITLNNSKSYVGWVKELPIPTISNFIRIIPIISGYRTPKSREIVFTTHYLEVYRQFMSGRAVKNIEDLEVDLVIAVGSIINISHFDLEMYEIFNTPDNPDNGEVGREDE